MGKIKVQSLLKKEIRAVIPYRDEEGNEQKIIIKNPSETLKRQTLKDFADVRQVRLQKQDQELQELYLLMEEMKMKY